MESLDIAEDLLELDNHNLLMVMLDHRLGVVQERMVRMEQLLWWWE